MSEKRRTYSCLKPWRGKRLLRQNIKANRRRYWSEARWQRYFDEREAKRTKPRRRHLKALREEAQAIENYRAHLRGLAAGRRRDCDGRFLPGRAP